MDLPLLQLQGDFVFNQGIGAGVGLYLCFIAFQSSEGISAALADLPHPGNGLDDCKIL